MHPPIQPYEHGFLKVSDLHEIYFEQAGNPQGLPVVFLHGGPGGGIYSKYRQFFDAKKYRVVLFDQRGSGQSRPHAELRENTTWDLVADIEKLRQKLGIEKWLVFGGSWGSTLALAYAQTHPTRVRGLMLRGIFLCRPSEIQWFYQEGASHVFPEEWERYVAAIPASEHSDLVRAYHKRLTSDDRETRLAAARAWSRWEAATSKLLPDAKAVAEFEEPDLALAFARIECHYFVNNAFFTGENHLFERIDKIRHIPCHIVQGRYDMVCPARSAWDLHKAWPEASLEIVPDAGHSASCPKVTQALLRMTERFGG